MNLKAAYSYWKDIPLAWKIAMILSLPATLAAISVILMLGIFVIIGDIFWYTAELIGSLFEKDKS